MSVIPKLPGAIARGVLASCFLFGVAFAARTTATKDAAIHKNDAAVESKSNISAEVRTKQTATLTNEVEDQIKHTDVQLQLVKRPLSAELLEIYGLSLEEKGKRDAALTAMRLANQTSRRAILSSLWLIEAASVSGDVQSAIRYYSTTLAVNEDLQSKLIPVLVTAIIHPEVRKALQPFIASRRIWTIKFLHEAAAKSTVSDLELLISPVLDEIRGDEYRDVLSSVLDRIARDTGADAAEKFAIKIFPGLEYKTLHSLQMTEQSTDPRIGQFAWKLHPDVGIEAIISDQGEIQIDVSPFAKSMVATKNIIVPPGSSMTLRRKIIFSPNYPAASVIWKARCLKKTPQPEFWALKESDQGRGNIRLADINIPSDCEIIKFEVHAEGPESQMASQLKINSLDIILKDETHEH